MGLAINNSPIDRLLEGVIVGISLNQPVFSNVIITRMTIDPFGLFDFPH